MADFGFDLFQSPEIAPSSSFADHGWPDVAENDQIAESSNHTWKNALLTSNDLRNSFAKEQENSQNPSKQDPNQEEEFVGSRKNQIPDDHIVDSSLSWPEAVELYGFSSSINQRYYVILNLARWLSAGPQFRDLTEQQRVTINDFLIYVSEDYEEMIRLKLSEELASILQSLVGASEEIDIPDLPTVICNLIRAPEDIMMNTLNSISEFVKNPSSPSLEGLMENGLWEKLMDMLNGHSFDEFQDNSEFTYVFHGDRQAPPTLPKHAVLQAFIALIPNMSDERNCMVYGVVQELFQGLYQQTFMEMAEINFAQDCIDVLQQLSNHMSSQFNEEKLWPFFCVLIDEPELGNWSIQCYLVRFLAVIALNSSDLFVQKNILPVFHSRYSGQENMRCWVRAEAAVCSGYLLQRLCKCQDTRDPDFPALLRHTWELCVNLVNTPSGHVYSTHLRVLYWLKETLTQLIPYVDMLQPDIQDSLLELLNLLNSRASQNDGVQGELKVLIAESLVVLFRFIVAAGESEKHLQVWLQLMESLWVNATEEVLIASLKVLPELLAASDESIDLCAQLIVKHATHPKWRVRDQVMRLLMTIDDNTLEMEPKLISVALNLATDRIAAVRDMAFKFVHRCHAQNANLAEIIKMYILSMEEALSSVSPTLTTNDSEKSNGVSRKKLLPAANNRYLSQLKARLLTDDMVLSNTETKVEEMSV